MMRVYQFILALCALAIAGCNRESENNKNNRNENWCWWVDEDSGKGMWIPIKNNSTVENGKYTLFYFNGSVYEKGTMKNKKTVDTTFYFDLLGVCYGYKLDSSDWTYFFKDGNYKTYYSSGQLNCIGIVTDHRVGDKWKVFYKSGKLSREINLINRVGYITEYFENGRKRSVIYTDTSLTEDLYVQQWYESGQLEYNSNIVNGKYNGIFKKYYENGQIEKVWEMKNGIHDGVSIEYYENGQIKKTWKMVNGLQEGISKGYYENGKIKEYFQVINDLKQGPATIWYENGNINALGNYKDNELDGLQKRYYENGILSCEGTMKAGKEEGEARRYDSLGNLERIELYSNGRRIK